MRLLNEWTLNDPGTVDFSMELPTGLVQLLEKRGSNSRSRLFASCPTSKNGLAKVRFHRSIEDAALVFAFACVPTA